MNWLEIIISILYASIGIIATIGYLPTIIDLYKKKKSANAKSYATWAFTYFIALIYASFIVKDLLFALVSGLGFLSCGLITVLTLRLKENS